MAGEHVSAESSNIHNNCTAVSLLVYFFVQKSYFLINIGNVWKVVPLKKTDNNIIFISLRSVLIRSYDIFLLFSKICLRRASGIAKPNTRSLFEFIFFLIPDKPLA